MFFGRLGPLQDEIEAQPALVVLAGDRKRRLVDRLRVALLEDLLEVIAEALAVLEDFALELPRLGGLVLEDDLDPFVEIARHLEALANDPGVERRLRKDRGVGTEEHGRPCAARRADLLDAANRLALFVLLLPREAIALDRGDQLARKGVHDRRADAV